MCLSRQVYVQKNMTYVLVRYSYASSLAIRNSGCLQKITIRVNVTYTVRLFQIPIQHLPLEESGDGGAGVPSLQLIPEPHFPRGVIHNQDGGFVELLYHEGVIQRCNTAVVSNTGLYKAMRFLDIAHVNLERASKHLLLVEDVDDELLDTWVCRSRCPE